MRRTNYQPIGEVLEEFFSQPYIAAKLAESRIPEAWAEVVGQRASSVTTDLRLENHVLYARLSSSVVRQELFYRRDTIATELNRVLGVKIINVLIIK